MTRLHLLLLAVFALAGTSIAAAATDADDDELVKLDLGGVLIEDYTYLRGVSRTDNVAAQWQRRRLVLGASMEVGKRVTLELEGGYGQADSTFKWRDAYVFFDLPNRLELRLGKMRRNFGLAQSTSLKNISTVERPLVTDLLPLGRATGAAFAMSLGPTRFELGAFRERDDEGRRLDSILVRGLYEHDADLYWHAGVSAGNTQYDGAVYRLSSRAGTDVMDNFLRSEKITADHVNYAGMDGVVQYGRATLQAEFIGSEVASTREGDRRYAGGYVQGTLFLTPDRHEFKDGGAGAVKPASDVAWEVVATWSTLDALSRNDGFAARTASAGLNAYYRSHLKVMAEVNALQVVDGKYGGEEGLAALLRVQYRF